MYNLPLGVNPQAMNGSAPMRAPAAQAGPVINQQAPTSAMMAAALKGMAPENPAAPAPVQGNVDSPLSALAGLAESAGAAHKKANPHMFGDNGGFNWGRVADPWSADVTKF